MPEGKAILVSLGIGDDYEGVGHCVLDYADGDAPDPVPRKANYVYYLD